MRIPTFVVVFALLAGSARAGVTLTASPSPATFGAPVTLTATVTPSTATGKVTFYDGAVVLGTATLSGGTATLIVPLNATGTRSLVARYLGDSSNSAAVSAVFSETVNSVPSFGFIPTNINFGNSVQGFAVGDFNGDGRPDVATVGAGNFIAVALGNGDGTFASPIMTQVNVVGTLLSVVAGDFNGDGKLDLAVGNGLGNYGNSVNSVEVLLGNGDGTFGSQTTYATDDGDMTVADFNLDGIPDLVIVHAQTFGIFLGKGDGTFSGPVEYSAGGTPSTVAVGDVNGDGKPDLVTIVPTANTQGSLIVVLIGNGDGTFSAPNSYSLFGSTSVEEFDQAIVLADFNGDGKLDLAIAGNFAHGVWLCLGNGDGTFAPVVPFNAGIQDEGSGGGIAAVDVNGDQKLDIVADFSLRSPLGYGLGNELQTFYGNGNGAFQPVEILAPPLTDNLYKLVPADFNGDGRVDLLSWGYDFSRNLILKLFSGAVIPALTVTSTHSGNLTPGQTGATFAVVVSNATGAAATVGPVTVAYNLGLMTLDSMVGSGWTCSNSSSICTRSDALAPGASYPPITVTADVALTAPPGPDGNYVIVSGGGSQTEEVNDATIIVPLSSGCTFSLAPSSVSLSGDATVSAVAVTTASGCNWLAASNSPWLTITSGASGSGGGSVNFLVGANPVSQLRAGTLTIAGQTFTVNQAAPTLAPTGVSPGEGSALSQTFAFTFTDRAGFADLSVVDVLINNYLDGIGACYFAVTPVSATSGYLYLVDDAGDGGYVSGTPMPLPSGNSLRNSQCTINGAGSSVSASANTLTITLSITFSSGFAGNRVFYIAARSNTQNSGWQAMGTWHVPGPETAGPAVGGVSPGQSNTNVGAYTFTFTDTNGFADLGVIDILINSFLDGTDACYVAYVPTSATTGYLYLVDDAGDGRYASGSPAAVPGNYALANSQCTVYGTVATASSNTLTLTLQFDFNIFNFAGNQVFYLAARNNSTGNSGWQAVGSVTVP